MHRLTFQAAVAASLLTNPSWAQPLAPGDSAAPESAPAQGEGAGADAPRTEAAPGEPAEPADAGSPGATPGAEAKPEAQVPAAPTSTPPKPDAPNSTPSFVYFVGAGFAMPFGAELDRPDSEFTPSVSLSVEAGGWLSSMFDLTGFLSMGVGGIGISDKPTQKAPEGFPGVVRMGPRAHFVPFTLGSFSPYVGFGGGLAVLTYQGSCEEDAEAASANTTTQDPAAKCVDPPTYIGLAGGPVVGIRAVELGNTTGDILGMAKRGHTTLFVQLAIHYGVVWGGPRTTYGTSAGDLDLHHYEISAGIAGF